MNKLHNCPHCMKPIVVPEVPPGIRFSEAVMASTFYLHRDLRFRAEDFNISRDSMTVMVSRIRTALKDCGATWQIVHVGNHFYRAIDRDLNDQDNPPECPQGVHS